MLQARIQFEEITEQKYQQFLVRAQHDTFYNSSSRFEFLKSQNRHLSFFKINRNDETIGLLHYQLIPAKTGKLIYFQHTPLLFDNSSNDAIVELFEALIPFVKDELRRHRVAFARFTSRIETNPELTKRLYALGYVRAPIQEIDACVTRVINLKEFDINTIRNTTRHSIQKGQKDGLVTIFEERPQDFSEFLSYYTEMERVKGFTPLPLTYLRKELEIYSSKGMLLQCKTRNADHVLTISQVIIYRNRAYYYHAATSNEGKQSNASPVNLYDIIQETKKRGLDSLDLWGGSVPDRIHDLNIPHPWKKLDIFKKGFANELYEFLPPLDLPYSWAAYAIPYAIQWFRTKRKGYPIVK